MARYYDPAIAHFIQPDSMLPEAGKSQGFDRYAYVNNNPVKYNDPSGHFVTVLAGAIIGGIVGGAMYGVSSSISGRSFNWGDLALSVGIGAAGGALIGTGAGAITGVAMLAAIGGGTGILGSEFGYQFTAGRQFKDSDLMLTCAVGGVAGAATGMLSAPGIGAAVGETSRVAINGLAGVADYSLRSLADESPITNKGIAASGMLGLAGGVIGELGPSANGIVGSSTKRIYEEGLPSSFNNAFPKSLDLTSQVFQSYLYQRLTSSSIIDNFFLGGIRNVGTSWTQEWLAK